MTDSANERRGELRSYVIGYASALVLTGAAFAVVVWGSLGSAQTLGIVLALGLVQILVHFRFFLHVSFKRSSRHDLQLIAFSTLIIVLMVSGTLVVIANLRDRMM